MKNLSLMLCVAALAASAALSTRGAPAVDAAQPDPDVTVRITLPPDKQHFKGGPEAGLALANCQTCHAADYIYTQPPLTKAQWVVEVTKMKNLYGAPIQQGDIDPIADYLVTQNGKT